MDMYPLHRPRQKKYNWTHRRRGTPLCLFTEVPKDITRNQAEGGLIDRQGLHTVESMRKWLFVNLKGYSMPTQPNTDANVDILTLFS